MKLSIPLMLTICLMSCNGNIQDKPERARVLEIVDEGLEKVQSNEYKEYFEILGSSDSLAKSLILQINSSNNEIAIHASKAVVEKTYQIERKIDAIIKELEEAYTLDENGNYNYKKDNRRINRIMIADRNGEQLGAIIQTSTEHLKELEYKLGFSKAAYLVKLQNNLKTPENESWAEYHFLNMPVVGALPILRKIRNDATMTRIALLESISKMDIRK